MKTQKQIDKEIAELKRLRPLIPEETYFGDNNLVLIDAQIRVLELGMRAMQIDERWNWDRAAEEDVEELMNIHAEALVAREWREFDGERPSKDWLPLAKKGNKK